MSENTSFAMPAANRRRVLALLTFLGAFATVIGVGMLHNAASAALTCNYFWKTTAPSGGDIATKGNWATTATGSTTVSTAPGSTSVLCLQTGAVPTAISATNLTVKGVSFTAGSLEITA